MMCIPARQQPLQILSSRGFSIVEAMVAMLLSLVLIGGLIETYIHSKQGYLLQKNINELQEQGRYSLNLISEDLRRAGFFNGNAGIEAIGGTAPPVTVELTCNTSNNSWGRMTKQSIFGLNDTNVPFNSTGNCIPDASYSGSDILVVRYASPVPVTETDMNLVANANRLYLRTSLFQGRLFKGQDQASNTITDIPQRVSELFAYAYYIGNSTQQCSGAPIPALFRIKLDADGRPAQEEVARGIERLQVQYGVGDDGAVTQYFDADNVTDWDKVVAVRIWLLTRSSCPGGGGYKHSGTYTMGDLAAYSPTDGYYRRLYSATVKLRNGK